MNFYVASDLHLEFGLSSESNLWNIPKDAKDSCLILAGDILTYNLIVGESNVNLRFQINKLLTLWFKSFQRILVITGNHEYYHAKLSISEIDSHYKKFYMEGSFITDAKYREEYLESPNITFLSNSEEFWFEDCVVVGTTLWTEAVDGCDPTNSFNDFNYIHQFKIKSELDRYSSYNELHRSQRDQLEKTLLKLRKDVGTDIPIVVVTHHAPSFKSIHPDYVEYNPTSTEYNNINQFIKYKKLNDFYAVEMKEALSSADVWIHGHVHHKAIYLYPNINPGEGDCLILCNPRGYEEKPNFELYKVYLSLPI